MSTRTITRTLVASAALALVACGSAPQNAENAQADNGSTGSMQQGRNGATSGGDTGGAQCEIQPVYFAYDSSELDGRARSSLESSARCLTQRNNAARVTGMTDPRGTEEYNLALGERRARTVTQYLTNMGVDQSRPHSVGEEMAAGNDESGWANDRRAEIRAE
jgi:peptidoglycan-associated lipoprotein